MKRAFAIGLLVSVAWSLIVPGIYDDEPVAVELATKAFLLGIAGVFLFYVLSYVRGSGFIAISIAVFFTLILCVAILMPILNSIILSFIYLGPEIAFQEIGYFLFDEYYWSYRFEEPLALLLSSPELLIIALAVTALVLTGGRGLEVEMTSGSSNSAVPGFAGEARRQDWSEVNRLILAHAYIGGSRFRRSVIHRARESFNAPALEAGIDMERLLRLCLVLERKETVHRAVMVLLGLGVVIGLAVVAETENPVFLIAVLVVAAIVNGIWRKNLFSAAYRHFGSGRFELDESRNIPAADLVDEQTHGLPPSGQNVVVYSGFAPFDFAGIPFGGWSVAIDTSRAASDITASGKTKPFTEGELRSLMSDELRKSNIEGLSVKDLAVAHGTDARVLPAAREHMEIKQPRVVLDAEEMDTLPGQFPNTLRRYLWISVRDWGGDLTVSAFWRCALRKRMLHVELSRFVLTPIAQSHRGIDHARGDWRYRVGQFMVGGILSPAALIGGPIVLLGQMQAGLARAFGSEKRARAKAIKLSPRYNFGAPRSLRVQLMGGEFLHYFQKMDQQYYEKTVDKILLESLFDFLEDHGIDTTDLKENQTAIFNSGVIVQGGDITAQSLAVGDKAKAKTNVVNRAVRKGATAIAGSTKS